MKRERERVKAQQCGVILVEFEWTRQKAATQQQTDKDDNKSSVASTTLTQSLTSLTGSLTGSLLLLQPSGSVYTESSSVPSSLEQKGKD